MSKDVVFDVYKKIFLKALPIFTVAKGRGNASGSITRFLQTESPSFVAVKARLNCFRSWLITDTRTINLQIKQWFSLLDP